MSPHSKAVLQALLVTFLWATSWVLIKIGLTEIPALVFAGLRYFLAFACLLPLALARWRAPGRPSGRGPRTPSLSPRDWGVLALLGLVLYTVTQGAQFLSLVYLPAATASLVLSFTPVAVAFSGMGLLGERPTRAQWAGVAAYLVGVAIYFQPSALPRHEWLGLGVALLGMLANAAGSLLGRAVNREARLSPLVVTTVSMGVGSLALLLPSLALHGWPALGLRSWLLVLWLAVVNTAFAFTLWNATLRRLSAMESSVVNNTMIVQIALLAWVFLGEALSVRQLLGIGLGFAGILAVQLAGIRRAAPAPSRGAEGAPARGVD